MKPVPNIPPPHPPAFGNKIQTLLPVGNSIQAMMTQRAWRCKEHVTNVCPNLGEM